LVVQAANDTYVGGDNFQSDRLRMQDEIDQLMEEIDAIATRTEFNTLRVLDGTFGRDGIPGTAEIGTVTNAITIVDVADGGITVNVTTPSVSEVIGTFTVSEDEFGNAISPTTFTSVVVTSAAQTIASVNAGEGTRTVTTTMHAVTAAADATPGRELWFQTGANSNQGINVNIENMNTGRLFGLPGFRHGQEYNDEPVRIINVLNRFGFEVQSGTAQHGDPINESIFGDEIGGWAVDNTIDAIDAALAIVTRQRSNLGAVQNRLEYTIENLDISSENLSAANSRIRDADMAREMMSLTQANVLQQAAISMLAQANQAPQSILQLLG
jgi:flagellin